MEPTPSSPQQDPHAHAHAHTSLMETSEDAPPTPPPPTPTTTVEQITSAILEIQAHVSKLTETQTKLQGQVDNQTYAAGLKIPAPEKFDGSQTKVKPFLTQLRLYFRVNQKVFQEPKDQVLAAGMYMKGDAIEWFQPYMDEVMNVAKERWKLETTSMFENFDVFARKLKLIFDEINK